MSANTKQVPKDLNGLPLLACYNENADRHDAVKGAGNAYRVRIADGDDVALGARSDAASSGALSGSFTIVSLRKEMLTHLRTLTS